MAAPQLMPQKLRVLNFVRVSTDRQDNERQAFDLADNVERWNLDVVDTIRLKISGPKVRQSDKWQAMLDRIPTAEIDAMNLSALDRLLRPEDFAIIGDALQRFRDHKKIIFSTKEEMIEPWTPRGWETCMQAMLQAGKELAELKRRTAGGRRKAHAQNKPMNTYPTYGMLYRDKYSRDADGKCQYFYEDPEPASNGQPRREIVEMIYRWRYVDRMRTNRIVRRLNELHILTAGKRKKDGSWQYKPGLWSRSTVILLLKNRKYIGEHWEGGKKVEVACPQFIEREVFEGVQQSFLAEKGKADRKGRDSIDGLLHDYLKCEACKGTMYYRRDRRHPNYHCHQIDHKLFKRTCTMRQVRAAIIEPVVFLAIWKHLTDPELLLANARAYYESLPARPEAAALETELAEVMTRIETTQEMTRVGAYPKDKGVAAILEDQKRIAQIKADLKATGVSDLPKKHQIESACRRLAEGRMPSKFDTQRPVLEKLVDLKVYWDGQDATITGSVPVLPADAAGQKGRKCSGRVSGPYTSTLFIPFKIKATIPPTPPRGTRESALKGWETRRRKRAA